MKRTTKKTLQERVLKPKPTLSPTVGNTPKSEVAWEEPVAALPSEEAETATTSAEEPAGEEDNGPDDALGLYLRQMGAIPLLSRKEELTLAQRLERQRTRYRRAALSNWRTLDLVV